MFFTILESLFKNVRLLKSLIVTTVQVYEFHALIKRSKTTTTTTTKKNKQKKTTLQWRDNVTGSKLQDSDENVLASPSASQTRGLASDFKSLQSFKMF